ncbi:MULTISPECIES: hypothetical protein [Anaeromyxobacter]|uniref:hypothetical protein n=1 Tax=Anaeromyxobacter TaxID=161492 RepID=UPI001F575066|nr:MULTISPECIES: hypothetical protein [unclassified Anaeromyxobacter]
MGLEDAVIAALVMAGALYLLYRSLWRGGGACHGCSSGGACSARARAPAPLVTLGRRPEPRPPRPSASAGGGTGT